jgi:hypothetical protein
MDPADIPKLIVVGLFLGVLLGALFGIISRWFFPPS